MRAIGGARTRPHLYLRDKAIPWAPNGQGMVVVAALSALILLAFTLPEDNAVHDATYALSEIKEDENASTEAVQSAERALTEKNEALRKAAGK